jgi:hypothetical protein
MLHDFIQQKWLICISFMKVTMENCFVAAAIYLFVKSNNGIFYVNYSPMQTPSLEYVVNALHHEVQPFVFYRCNSLDMEVTPVN